MPYTNDDAYTEGWNDAMKEMKEEMDKLKAEIEKLTIEASKGKALEEFICNGQGWGDFIEGITDEDKQDLIDAGHDKDDFEDSDDEEDEDSLPFGVMAWSDDTEEDLCEFNTIEEGKEYIKNMGDDRDDYDHLVVFDRTGYNAEIDNADTITILYEWVDECSTCHKQLEGDKLKAEVEKLKKEIFDMCEIANANNWDIYPECDEEESDDEEDERMVDWKAGEFCCVDYKFRGKCSVCNEEGRWVAVDKDDDGKDEPVMCCYGCDTGIDDEEEE